MVAGKSKNAPIKGHSYSLSEVFHVDDIPAGKTCQASISSNAEWACPCSYFHDPYHGYFTALIGGG